MGSSNVVVAVAEKLEDGNLALRALVSKPLKAGDVVAGQIENINQVGEAVVAAFNEAGQEANIRITEAFAGVSGEFVRCARHTDYVFVSNPQNCVSEQDVAKLFDRMRNLQAPEKEVIMEHIPQNYVIDDRREVRDPNGSFGRKLSSTFNFVLCATTPMERVGLAFKRAGVELADVLPNVLSAGESVLNDDEKEEGVAVVNLGAEVTDVTIYHGGVVRYVASIPMGANVINQDIRAMGVPERYIENLKLRYGSAVSELVSSDKLIRVNGRARITHDILQYNLAAVIESRVMDIIEFVTDELQISGYADRLGYGIVLTGGSANLKEIDLLFHKATKMDVRVALPEFGFTPESLEIALDPSYATVAGLLLRAAARRQQGTAFVPLPPREVPTPEVTEPATPIVAPAAPTVVTPETPRVAAPVAAPTTPDPVVKQTPVVKQAPSTVVEPQSAPEPPRPAVQQPVEVVKNEPADQDNTPSDEPNKESDEQKPTVADSIVRHPEDDEELIERPKKKGGFGKWFGDIVSGIFSPPQDEEL